ncbi:MAG: hypothetical protein WDO19_29150 [Bacteroidota bacterium]
MISTIKIFPVHAGFESENKKLKMEALGKQRPEDIEKRKKQDGLLRKIKSRMPAEYSVY